MNIANHAYYSDGPKRSVHQLLILDDPGELVKGDTRESSDLVVIDDQAHWNSFDEQVKLHLFYSNTLHVGLHGRPHDVMCWVNHYKPV